MSESPSILIVGAGALGLTCAHYLQLGGSKISFLVRPHRLASLGSEQRLYCYNDASIKTLSNFNVISEPEEVEGARYDFVMMTPDGAVCRSPDGVATLQILGKKMRGTESVLIINGVGLGLYEHILQTTGLPKSQVMQGSMAMLSYQVGAEHAPQPPEDSKAQHDSADYAYSQVPGKPGFMMAKSPKQATARFTEVFERCGIANCRAMPDKLYQAFTSAFATNIAALSLDGWRGAVALSQNRELWPLACAAQREIITLRQHGLLAKVMAKLMSDKKLADMAIGMEEDALPLDYNAFNRCHHGSKVWGQNRQILENCLNARLANGQSAPALQTLLSKLDN